MEPARPRSDSLCAPRPAGGGWRRPEAGERRHGTGASGRGRRADGRGKQGLRLRFPKRDHVDPTAFRTQTLSKKADCSQMPRAAGAECPLEEKGPGID
ncbi:hypothetical protein STEG23_006353, partial [Scotinomys teguina]